MARWQKVLAHVANNVEEHFDKLKSLLGKRFDPCDPIKIIAYRGYGNPKKLYLKGRVLKDKGINPVTDNDTLWNNLVNTYKRFESDEIPGARVLARFQQVEQEVVTDAEGYFELWIEPAHLPSTDGPWHQIELELLEPQCKGQEPVRSTGYVVIPSSSSRFGVISDIDDTVVRTDVTSLVRMARIIFLGNARTRLPFEGVSAFYEALQMGSQGTAFNPLFYVSSSPWNLYELLIEFFEIQEIPIGPLLLRDWGISAEQSQMTRRKLHKLSAIHQILEFFPQLSFILIGDSGQEDPEIYRDIIHQHPNRILAVYIRNISRNPQRSAAIRALAEEIVQAGSRLILADDTLAAAEHAAEQGWISFDSLSSIQAKKEEDKAEPMCSLCLCGE